MEKMIKVTELHKERTEYLASMIEAYYEDIGNYFKKYPFLFLYSLLALSGRKKIQNLLKNLENESQEISDPQDKYNFLLSMAIDDRHYREFQDEIAKFIYKEIGVQ